ncbi:exonuclease domain-containing protein [Legionella sp. D16C41]|uniref:3'-5' exonuclease family protein n=1 Tax=Legionella sp. D16C41 TaxID=3402688 RepID=UPI003AF51C89
MQQSFKWALIDLETTGLHIKQDRIIEIAVIILSEQGILATWHSLINPERSIPEPITQLTGINNSLVSQAPVFQSIAEELILLLNGCVLVAHNARFDYSFLKNAFKLSQITFQAPVLCTIKLLKNFYPALNNYKLASIAEAFGLEINSMHRAEKDVNLLQKIISRLADDFSLVELLNQAKKIYKQPSIPSTLVTDCNILPETPGVYIFYGNEKSLPLYIGKSVSIRQRVLSHFQADHSNAKEFTLSQQVKYIETIPTAGELSALILESTLIKEKMPVYNRRLRRKKNLVVIKTQNIQGYLTLAPTRTSIDEEEEFELITNNLYGAFRSVHAVKKTLLSWIKEYELCPKLCGIEQARQACFSYQLHRCHGACIQIEASEVYNSRVTKALKQFKREAWPFRGSIAIKEVNESNKITQYLVFNQWRYLGSVASETELETLKERIGQTADSFDNYKILLAYLKNKQNKINLIELAW